MAKVVEPNEIYKCLDIEDLPDEEWRSIFDFDGIYEVSSLGRVKALPIVKGHGRYFHLHKPKILKPKIAKCNGYLQVVLCCDGKRTNVGVHRLVGLAFVPNPENKPTINHKFGNKKDNRACVLEWATHKEQINHADSTGLRNVRGEGTGASKLKNEDIFLIRNTEISISELAITLGVHQSCIRKVRRNQTWTHL